MTPNQRKDRRTDLNRRCWIAIDPVHPLECILTDISDTGAKLTVPVNLTMPEHVELLLTDDGRISRKSQVVWQKEREVGLRFKDRGIPAPKRRA